MGVNTFLYSINNIELDENTTKKDLLLMLKKHDYDSYVFSFFTGAFNYALCKELNQSEHSDYRLLFECGILHDIGKLGMSRDFINYPGQYSFVMYEEMKKHPEGGAKLLSQIKGIEQEIIDTANYHHCNFDGSGYPGDLYGKEIPFCARLTRVSDSLDAYLSKRCYKDGGPATEAFDDLNTYNGTSYDPDIIDAFSRVHFNIIEKSHKNGEDRPSKSLYTHYLIEIYLDDFEIKSMDDALIYL